MKNARGAYYCPSIQPENTEGNLMMGIMQLTQNSNIVAIWTAAESLILLSLIYPLTTNELTRGCYPGPNLTNKQELFGKVEVIGTLRDKESKSS